MVAMHPRLGMLVESPAFLNPDEVTTAGILRNPPARYPRTQIKCSLTEVVLLNVHFYTTGGACLFIKGIPRIPVQEKVRNFPNAVSHVTF